MTNNKAQHTPGPWEACQDSIGRWYIIAPRASRHDVLISPILPCPTEGFAEANARLIAAAPELLEECKKNLWWLQHVRSRIQGPKNVMLGFDQAIKYLGIVIAKAEGK